MGKRLRTFVAFRCAPEVCRRLAREAERLSALDGALRVPQHADLHLTLQFLGDTDETDVAPIGHALAAVAGRHAPLDVSYVGLGAFPEAARARVVWAGIREEGPAGALGRLVADVGDALAPLGHPPERRPFHPHVTLGRLRARPRPELVRAVEAAQELALGEEILSDLKLILSDPGGGRYRYIDLTTASLGTDEASTAGAP